MAGTYMILSAKFRPHFTSFILAVQEGSITVFIVIKVLDTMRSVWNVILQFHINSEVKYFSALSLNDVHICGIFKIPKSLVLREIVLGMNSKSRKSGVLYQK